MSRSLNILIVSSECAPFAKVGGLGDVVGSLPPLIRRYGHDIRIVIPKYSFIDEKKYKLKCFIEDLDVRTGAVSRKADVYETAIDGDVPVYFIAYDPFYKRDAIYHDSEFHDYADNPDRFAFLSKAALELCIKIHFIPDVVHANDWHTALIPAFLKNIYSNSPVLGKAASILTIHNIAYQGRYSKDFYFNTGLPESDFVPEKFECYGAVNFLKGGIYYADAVNTVSRGYASETRTRSGGYGMDSFLISKGDDYVGILNGVDYTQWNPETDKLIPSNYTPDRLDGKQICKKALQKRFRLKNSNAIPVVGLISRFVEQKGLYILSQCIEDIVNYMDVQFVLLGAGDKQLEEYYGSLPEKYPHKIGSYIGYDNNLAHLIEAGSDLFLMPSIYEPCGLNQIYSLKYGTLPVVRATGGLDETVENYDQDNGNGTGFKFYEPSAKAIFGTVKWAVETYYLRKSHFMNLMQNAMRKHFSWEDSAKEYVRLYEKAIKNKRKNK